MESPRSVFAEVESVEGTRGFIDARKVSNESARSSLSRR